MSEEFKEGEWVELVHLSRDIIITYYGEFPYKFLRIDDDDKNAAWVCTPKRKSVPFHISALKKCFEREE